MIHTIYSMYTLKPHSNIKSMNSMQYMSNAVILVENQKRLPLWSLHSIWPRYFINKG